MTIVCIFHIILMRVRTSVTPNLHQKLDAKMKMSDGSSIFNTCYAPDILVLQEVQQNFRYIDF